ncbi:unnamed protein product [Paramecium sonneborni]|uniref:Uncharacterized protein n=1 Tax=Paramecium sonneborni TaxID=65129 RepID=A0A8S1RRF2_9CILI|nr:unnamed protein product [Paramecium sonneborni]
MNLIVFILSNCLVTFIINMKGKSIMFYEIDYFSRIAKYSSIKFYGDSYILQPSLLLHFFNLLCNIYIDHFINYIQEIITCGTLQASFS